MPKANLMQGILTGYEIRRSIEERQMLQRQLKQREADSLRDQAMQAYKLDLEQQRHEEDMMQRELDRNLRERDVVTGEQGLILKEKEVRANLGIAGARLELENLRAGIEKKKLEHQMKIDALNYGVQLSALKQKNIELRFKASELGSKALDPIINRYQGAISEANKLREKAFSSPMYVDKDAREAARRDLDAKMEEINSISGIIDKLSAQQLTTGSLEGGAKLGAREQQDRDTNIAGATKAFNIAKMAANVKFNNEDSNIQVARLKFAASVPIEAKRAKVVARIKSLEEKYQTDVAVNPYAQYPKAQIDALLYDFANTIQQQRKKDKYLQVDDSILQQILQQGQQQ